MSFTSHSTYEEHTSDNRHTIARSTVIVHELTEREFNSILTMADGTGEAEALKVPQVQYEIESGTSDVNESSDEDDNSEDDYSNGTSSDEFILDHWFPSLLHKSMIEFLDDGEDDFMLDHSLDILTSTESAEIEEEEDEKNSHTTTQYDDDEDDEELEYYQPRTRKQRKRSKHKHHDENEEDMSIPVDVIHIPATTIQDDEHPLEADASVDCLLDTESVHSIGVQWPSANLVHHNWRQDKERLSFKDDYVSFPSLEIFEVAAGGSPSKPVQTMIRQ
ncbi:hypothetical protein BX666DRAFT_2024393 [Dichotomocladium elegans]|nr:hypothetical protein BX666DRAFT_2024393 [Dichotomocladium elegans]